MTLATRTQAETLAATATLADLAAVTTRTVTFETAGSTLNGTLYLPAGHDGTPLPTVVVTGAWTTVQQQMPATYARQMVARGFAAFTFDFRGWGLSGDLPQGQRYIESPAAKIADIRAAFDTVATLPEVDAGQIHGLGICASSGYMVDAAAGNTLVQRVGLVAPWLQDAELVNAVYGGAEAVAGLIEIGRNAAAAGGQIIPAAGPEGAEGVLMPLGGYYYEADRGAIPEYDNKWNMASWEGWLTYHPADNPARLTQPLAVVHSDAAAIPDGAKRFVRGVSGPVVQDWLANVTQFDFYDTDAVVTRAADTVAAHFRADSVA